MTRGVRAEFAAGMVALLLCGATTGPAAATPHRAPDGPDGTDRTTQQQATTSPLVSRVDVSHRPDISAVLTLPPGTTRTPDLRLDVDGKPLPMTAAPLSAQDIELVLIPDTTLPPALFDEQRRALITLTAQLPTGARTTVIPAGPLTAGRGNPRAGPPNPDPVGTVRTLSALRSGPVTGSPAQRLEYALAVFSPGTAVRRTLVLVTDDSRPESPALLAHLGQRLAASGSQLFVLDLGAGADVSALAADSAGTASRAAPGAGAFTALTSPREGIAAVLDRQYHLRFRTPDGTARLVRLTSGTPRWQLDVPLPERNPTVPPAWLVPPELAGPGPDRFRADAWLVAVAALVVLGSLFYGLGMLAVSRREPRRSGPAGPTTVDELFFVFLLPCLNEERVIRASVERLLSLPANDCVVMVIDDGSDDATADIVRSLPRERVWLLQRHPPEARQGKGEALNAAVRHLVDSDLLTGRDPDRVVLVIIDADGRLEEHALREVRPHLADPQVGGVQIGVRINNRRTNLLARMQDLEFVFYTHVFQRGRRHLGSVGLGGNGQFMRLSALLSLGRSPWSRSLTEDLDLGVRLIGRGWRNEYCPTAAVHQQGVVSLRRLIHQRTRWFQGHLQSWRLLGLVVREVPAPARADLLYHLTSPVLLLIASLLSVAFLLGVLDSVLLALSGHNPLTWWALSSYLLAVGPALGFGYVYWRTERGEGLTRGRALLFAHLYVVYGLMWYLAGWRAVTRILRGHTGWAKTERAVEPAGTPAGSADPTTSPGCAPPRPVLRLPEDPLPESVEVRP